MSHGVIGETAHENELGELTEQVQAPFLQLGSGPISRRIASPSKVRSRVEQHLEDVVGEQFGAGHALVRCGQGRAGPGSTCR